MKKILVVGGAGYVGGITTDLLLTRRFDVTVFDSLLYESRFLKPCNFIYGDIRDTKKLVEISTDKTIALVFGIEFRKNKYLKKVKKESNIHFDITNKKIKLSLDSEIGAVCTSLFNFKKD